MECQSNIGRHIPLDREDCMFDCLKRIFTGKYFFDFIGHCKLPTIFKISITPRQTFHGHKLKKRMLLLYFFTWTNAVWNAWVILANISGWALRAWTRCDSCKCINVSKMRLIQNRNLLLQGILFHCTYENTSLRSIRGELTFISTLANECTCLSWRCWNYIKNFSLDLLQLFSMKMGIYLLVLLETVDRELNSYFVFTSSLN